jgi:hypothetical protein
MMNGICKLQNGVARNLRLSRSWFADSGSVKRGFSVTNETKESFFAFRLARWARSF